MAGTTIFSMLESGDPNDKFPHVDGKKILGGPQIRDNLIERDAIDMEIRQEGQECYVKALKKTYKLEGGIQNINWIEKVTSNVTFNYVTPEQDGTLNI